MAMHFTNIHSGNGYLALKLMIQPFRKQRFGNTAQLPNEQKYDIIDIWKDK